MSLPTKPIQKAVVFYQKLWGANSDIKYEINFLLDIEQFHVSEREESIDKARRQIVNLYTFLMADVPTWVKFDFEI